MSTLLFLLAMLAVPSLATAAACPGSGLAYSCPAGTTPATVQDTITAASDGATISFAAGSYTWGSAAFYIDGTKGVTLQGAGIDQTIVTVESPGGVCCSNGHFSGTVTKAYRITGFTFQDAPANVVTFVWSGTAGAKLTNLRIDHNKFKDFGSNNLVFGLGHNSSGGVLGSQVLGVADHNEFVGTSANFGLFKILGIGTADFLSIPQTSTVRGTDQNFFIEDNSMDMIVNTGSSIPCVDVWSAGTVVVRFNYIHNCVVGGHGTVHQGGPVNWELYGNVSARDAGSIDVIIREGYRIWDNHGAWESYVWNNTVQHIGTLQTEVFSLQHSRSADMVESFGAEFIPPDRCDGNTATRDGNLSVGSPYYGYPCWGQPGRAPANGSPVWGTLAPVYVWKNIDGSNGDSKIDMIVANPFSTNQPPSALDHVVEGRDMYNAVSKDAQTSATSPFDGTTGVGFGTLANRPTTCTHTTSPDGDDGGGVAYWATDQGSWNQSSSNPQGVNVAGADGVLYRCSATNTWTAHYTPYTYPHPLQGVVAQSGSASSGSMSLTGSVTMQ